MCIRDRCQYCALANGKTADSRFSGIFVNRQGLAASVAFENLAAGNNALSPVPDALGGMRF